MITGLGTIVTYSRSGWVGFRVGLVVILGTAPKDRRKMLIIATLVLAIAAVPFLPSSGDGSRRLAAQPAAVTRSRPVT